MRETVGFRDKSSNPVQGGSPLEGCSKAGRRAPVNHLRRTGSGSVAVKVPVFAHRGMERDDKKYLKQYTLTSFYAFPKLDALGFLSQNGFRCDSFSKCGCILAAGAWNKTFLE